MRAAIVLTLALIAAAQAAGPTILTKANFNDLVFNSGKSAFVKFYAPWCVVENYYFFVGGHFLFLNVGARCGHCKSMKPAWDQLGDEYASSSSVIIAVRARGRPPP